MINEARQNLRMLKNYGTVILVFFSAAILSKGWIMEAVILIKGCHSYLNYAVSAALVTAFIFKKTAVIRTDPAAIHHFIGTSFLEKLLKIKLVLHFSVCVILSIILALLFCEKFSVVYLIHSASLFIVWVLLKWHSYHEKNRYLSLAGVCILINILYSLEFAYMGIFINTIIAVCFTIKAPVMNWKKNFKEMKFYSIVKASAARRDYGVMMALANENAVKDSYRIPYICVKNVNPLITKSIIIDGLRGAGPIWGIKIFALALSLSSFYIPFESIYRTCFFLAAWSCLINIIIKSSVQAVLNLQAKSRQGLFIPAAPWKTALCYSVFPLFEAAAANGLLAICAGISGWLITFMLLCQAVVIYGWHFISINHISARSKIDFAGSIIAAAMSFGYLYMGLV